LSSTDPRPVNFDDTWAIARVTVDSATLFVRFRQHLRPLAGIDQLPNRLSVVWLYDSEPLPDSHGMPSGNLVTQMTALEDALANAID